MMTEGQVSDLRAQEAKPFDENMYNIMYSTISKEFSLRVGVGSCRVKMVIVPLDSKAERAQAVC